MKLWQRIITTLARVVTRLAWRKRLRRDKSPVWSHETATELPMMASDIAASMTTSDITASTTTSDIATSHPSSPATANAATCVASPASVTFGLNSYARLPRSQVLSWLRSDCRASARRIDLIVLHCAATRPSQNFTIQKLEACHKARGFGAWPGYHIYIRRDGTMYYCRPVSKRGCHVRGWNEHSIGVCYEGGVADGPGYVCEDNRTAEQLVVIDEVLRLLHEEYPEARVTGHRDLTHDKACPCLDPPTAVQYGYIFGRT